MAEDLGRVLRYEIPVDDCWHRLLPSGPILHVATRRPDVVEVWAASGQPDIVRELRVFGTGQPIPDGAIYVGTAIVPGGAFVWHLMERAS